jgi:hypothetical protein
MRFEPRRLKSNGRQPGADAPLETGNRSSPDEPESWQPRILKAPEPEPPIFPKRWSVGELLAVVVVGAFQSSLFLFCAGDIADAVPLIAFLVGMLLALIASYITHRVTPEAAEISPWGKFAIFVAMDLSLVLALVAMALLSAASLI